MQELMPTEFIAAQTTLTILTAEIFLFQGIFSCTIQGRIASSAALDEGWQRRSA